jgi:hypothetical protein
MIVDESEKSVDLVVSESSSSPPQWIKQARESAEERGTTGEVDASHPTETRSSPLERTTMEEGEPPEPRSSRSSQTGSKIPLSKPIDPAEDGGGRFDRDLRNSSDWSTDWPARITGSRSSRSNLGLSETLPPSPLVAQNLTLGRRGTRESSYTPSPITPDDHNDRSHRFWESSRGATIGPPLPIATPPHTTPQHHEHVGRGERSIFDHPLGPSSGPQQASMVIPPVHPYPSSSRLSASNQLQTPYASAGSSSSASARPVPTQNPITFHRVPSEHFGFNPSTEAGPSSLPTRVSASQFDRYFPGQQETMTTEIEPTLSSASPFGHLEYTSMAPSASRKRLTGKSNTPSACSACKK